MFSKKSPNTIDIKTADAILQNVFKACDADPNSISLAEIEAKNKSDYKSDTLLIIVASVLLLITILVPLLFKSADAFISVDAGSQRTLTVASHELAAESFTLSFVGPAVDAEKSYIECNDGTIIKPIKYIRSTNTIVFPGLYEESNIYIYDINGATLHMLFAPH